MNPRNPNTNFLAARAFLRHAERQLRKALIRIRPTQRQDIFNALRAIAFATETTNFAHQRHYSSTRPQNPNSAQPRIGRDEKQNRTR